MATSRRILELSANYTHLDDQITATSDPLSLGKSRPIRRMMPSISGPRWSPTPAWIVGGGLTAVSHRYADTENTAGVPAYVVFNAMTSYKVNEHLQAAAQSQ